MPRKGLTNEEKQQIIDILKDPYQKHSSRAIERKTGLSKSRVGRFLKKYEMGQNGTNIESVPITEESVPIEPPQQSTETTETPEETLRPTPKLRSYKKMPVILPKFPDIVEFVEKWKREHPPLYKLKCVVCEQEYSEIVKKCVHSCMLGSAKKKKPSTLKTYWELTWPYELTFLNNPKKWKGLIQSILEMSETIMNP